MLRCKLFIFLRFSKPQIVLQVRNTSTEPIQVSLQVEGDFPETWCWIGMEGSEILPHQTMDAVLYFRVPAEFFDSDREIEKRCGVDIDWIFDLEGEAGFRQREQDILDELANRQGIVLATVRAGQERFSVPF